MDVIFLNGASGSGKSSIAGHLQDLSHQPYLHIGIDSIIGMMPAKVNNLTGEGACSGFYWREVALNGGQRGFKIQKGEYAQQLNTAYRKMLQSLLQSGIRLIVDEVIDGDSEMQIWRRLLQPFNCFYVAIDCNLAQLQRREIARGNRKLGSSCEQFYRVHQAIDYDLRVDTHTNTSIECAALILCAIEDLKRNQL
ncbi:MAG: hypothetical protein OFPI_15080 [Osedax symbiont Rs2]|nr:MAG: hypothetical protein OFPI_15080 [Osedax symbiont Rs2]